MKANYVGKYLFLTSTTYRESSNVIIFTSENNNFTKTEKYRYFIDNYMTNQVITRRNLIKKILHITEKSIKFLSQIS